MDIETISTIAEIGTAIGTFLLAVATFQTLRDMRKERNPDISIIPSTKYSEKYKFRHKPENEYSDETNDLGFELAPTTVFKVINKGQRVVTLDKFELWFENAEMIDVNTILRDHYETSSETNNGRIYVMQDLPAKPLPYDLLPGKNYQLFLYVDEISKALARKHYSGDVTLIGRFIDPIGKSYKSEPYYFDIEGQSKRASEELIET